MPKTREFMESEDIVVLEEILALPWERAWPRIQDVWARAGAVHTDLVGSVRVVRETLPFALVTGAARRFGPIDEDLLRATESPNPILAAYAVLCLDCRRRGDQELPLSDALLRRRETFEVLCGCFRARVTLGDFAAFRKAAEQAPVPKSAEKYWRGRHRACPKCGRSFLSLQDLGDCPDCRHRFRASEVHLAP